MSRKNRATAENSDGRSHSSPTRRGSCKARRQEAVGSPDGSPVKSRKAWDAVLGGVACRGSTPAPFDVSIQGARNLSTVKPGLGPGTNAYGARPGDDIKGEAGI